MLHFKRISDFMNYICDNNVSEDNQIELDYHSQGLVHTFEPMYWHLIKNKDFSHFNEETRAKYSAIEILGPSDNFAEPLKVEGFFDMSPVFEVPVLEKPITTITKEVKQKEPINKESKKEHNESMEYDNEFIQLIIANPRFMKHKQSISDEIKAHILTKRPSSIKFMENPSEILQVIAVTSKPSTIEYIKNPTPLVQSLVS